MASYVHGSAIDQPLAREDGTGVLSFLHADALGSIIGITNSSGAVIASRRYDAFGNLELGAVNGYAFTGREWDSETVSHTTELDITIRKLVDS